MAYWQTFIDRLEQETPVALHTIRRDLGKRISALAFVSVAIWFSGATGWLPLLLLSIALSEVIAFSLAFLRERTEGQVRNAVSLGVLANCVVSTVIYLVPCLLLAQHGSIPLLIAAYIWLFGVMVHLTNTFYVVPLFSWGQVSPCLLAAFALLREARMAELPEAPAWEWAFAAGTFLVYGVNTYQTLTMQKDTQRALVRARGEAQRRLRELEEATRHDGLTGLLTREAFDAGLAEMLSRQKAGSRTAFFLIDLDQFKPINDSYGHYAGDEVLRVVAMRIRSVLGNSPLVARLGGDEFVAAVSGLDGQTPARRLAARLLTEIAKPIAWRQKSLLVTASIGISLTDPGRLTGPFDGLAGEADQAMYRAKSLGGGRAVHFHPSSFRPRLSLEDRARIAEALRAGRIRPFYQPKVQMETGDIIGFEALARWVEPDGKLRPPSEFLPHINEFGMQGDFTVRIMETVLRDLTQLIDEGHWPGQVSVNISEMTLASPSGRSDIDRILDRYARRMPSLTFEITEDVFLARAGEYVQASISHFRNRGLRVSLDDFGTGFASFQHLRQLDYDELKIDQSFIADLGADGTAEVLIAGFLAMSDGLGVAVVAEGVETEAQRDWLLARGCRIGQGYLFGKAASFEDMAAQVRSANMRRPITVGGVRPAEALPPPGGRAS